MIVMPFALVWRIWTDPCSYYGFFYANHELLAFCLRLYISDSEGETTMLPISFCMPMS